MPLVTLETLIRSNMEPSTSPALKGDTSSNGLVMDTMKSYINSIDTDTCKAGIDDSFFVAELGVVYRQHLRWKANLKRVTPHYGSCMI